MQQAERSQGENPPVPLNHQRGVVLAVGERWRAAAGRQFQLLQVPGTQPEVAERSIAVMEFIGTQAPLSSLD